MSAFLRITFHDLTPHGFTEPGRYLVADSSKFGRQSVCRIAPLESLTGVITDKNLSTKQRNAVRRNKTQLILAAVLEKE